MLEILEMIGAMLLYATIAIIGVLIIMFLIILGCDFVIDNFTDYPARHNEWKTKVNNCVLNPEYRSDCKLILYKDSQNKQKQSTTMFIPTPVVIR